MKTLLSLVLITFLSPTLILGQGSCTGLIDRANKLIKNRQFDEAILKIEAAKGCATQGDVDKLYTAVFAGLKQQNKEAKAAKDKAEKAEADIKIALMQLKEEKEHAITQKTKAVAAEKKATSVLDKIYFYAGKFGLAYDKGRYGFIDKDLKTKIAFKYEEALPFDETGLAKVKSSGIYYLIDTLGNEYRLATDTLQLYASITALDLRNKKLTNIPPCVFEQKQLKVLLLGYNDITILSDSIQELTYLLFLNLNNNQLTSLPESFSKLSALQSLDLGFNQLTNLPESFSKLSALQSLDLKFNQLTNLPESFCNLSALQSLDLIENYLTNLPESFSKLSALKSLDLSVNQLTNLPESVTKLSSLQSLVLNSTHLTNLPESFSKLSALKSLVLSRNQLTNFPESVSKLSALQSLDLGFNQLTSLPESVSKLSALQSLDLIENQLTSLPESFSQLSALQSLDLRYNQLTNLLESFSNLPVLQSLSLGSNHLTNLPESFSELSALQSLDLGSNHLTNLPESFSELSALQSLDLRYNHLTNLPESFSKLLALQSLDLKSNKLMELPSSFCAFKNIGKFDFSNNPIKKVPDCLLPQFNKMKADEAYQAASKFFRDSNYVEAYKAVLLSTELDTINANKYFGLSFYALFVGEYQKSIEAAQKTLQLNPESVSVETNLALGYLLNNQYDKSEAIYKKWKGKKFSDDDRDIADKAFLQDIKDLETVGIHHKDFARVRQLLSK